MSTIAELIANAYQEPRVPRIPPGTSLETRLAMHLDYRVSQVMRRDALLRVAAEALKVLAGIPYEAFLDHRPEHILMAWNKHKLTVADVIAARAALAAIKPPMDAPIAEGERTAREAGNG